MEPSMMIKAIAAAAIAIGMSRRQCRVAQSMPDTENGRYALSPVANGMLRLDTRTGVTSICSDKGTGWALHAMPDEAPRHSTRKSASLQKDNEALKAQLAQRERRHRKIDEPLPKTDPLKKAGPKSGGGRAQDRIPCAEPRRHGPHDGIRGAGLAAAGRDGQPDAEGRFGKDLRPFL